MRENRPQYYKRRFNGIRQNTPFPGPGSTLHILNEDDYHVSWHAKETLYCYIDTKSDIQNVAFRTDQNEY